MYNGWIVSMALNDFLCKHLAPLDLMLWGMCSFRDIESHVWVVMTENEETWIERIRRDIDRPGRDIDRQAFRDYFCMTSTYLKCVSHV